MLAGRRQRSHPAGMFVVTEAEAAAIRAVYEQRGEFSAAVELRRLFPGRHRHRAGPRLCPDHRRLEAAAREARVRRLRPRAD